MCGIVGIVHFDIERPVDKQALQAMTHAIRHRGPDDDGFFTTANIGLGMRRLSIVDITGGKQPLFNEDKSIATLYNGEIYNYPSLRQNMEQRGHVFRTNVDTEILVHLYEEYGTNLLQYLNGMFAFVIYDKKRELLFVARDRLGIKPLYYTIQNNTLLFGSEIKSFSASNLFTPALNTEAMHHYLSFRFVPTPLTMFKNVYKLEPGHFFVYKKGNMSLSTQRYWDLSFTNKKNSVSPDDLQEELKALVDDAVAIRLRADVPLGVMLSGGVDSASLTAAMATHRSNTISTFTIDYDEEGPHREGYYAKLIADAFKTDHHEIIVSYDRFMENLDMLVFMMDEPLADPAAIPIFNLCTFSREHVTVLLCGAGNDEIFGGYNSYQEAVLRTQVSFIPRVLWRNILSPFYSALPGIPGKNFISRLGSPIEMTFLGSSHVYGGFSEKDKKTLYTPDFSAMQSSLSTHEVIQSTARAVSQATDMQKMMYIDIKHWLADSHLVMMDKMSMGASLELRVPLLDHRLVEFSATVPDNLKRTCTASKRIFKQAFDHAIPREVSHRPKRGFSTPLDLWFKEKQKDIKHLLLGPQAVLREYVKPAAVNELFTNHNRSIGDYSAHLFNLLVLELWMKRFL